MRKIEKKISEYEDEVAICDFCGEYSNYTVCEICNKDICDDCVGKERVVGGDVEYFCKKCWKTGGFYMEKIKRLNEKIDHLIDEWRENAQK